MPKIKVDFIYSCYQCKYFKRIKDISILRDLKMDIEGACYGHSDMFETGAVLAMPIYKIEKTFPDFCGLADLESLEQKE